jgi:hypothetical protein
VRIRLLGRVAPVIRLGRPLSLIGTCGGRQLILSSTFCLPNVSINDCLHLATEPTELRLWLHFLLDVQPAAGGGENHFVWKTRPGFPYGYACISSMPLPVRSSCGLFCARSS